MSKPPKPPCHEPGANDQALQQAVGALQSGRLQEAEWLAADVLKRSPSDARGLQIFGNALLMQGKAVEAIAPLEQAARRTHDPAVETQFAMALSQAGRGDEALARLDRAIKRRPPFPPAFHICGNLLAAQQRYDEAAAVVRQGLALTPNVAELSSLLGDILVNHGDRAGARAAYGQAITHAPRNVDALWGLARALEADGDFAQAAEIFRRMLAVVPADAPASIGLGACLLELGQPDAAFETFRMAARSGDKMYGEVLTAVVTSQRGRLWLRPSEAKRFLREKQ
jgi:cytochrome c-type biogenesis protein CcmH/NrfG